MELYIYVINNNSLRGRNVQYQRQVGQGIMDRINCSYFTNRNIKIKKRKKNDAKIQSVQSRQ